MKFAHISDLHLGKRIHQFSMIEEQKYILEKIENIVKEEKVDGVLIAGDVYDKIYPSAEAVALFDLFLVHLAKEEVQVFVISGNHDSPERIAFLGELTKKAGVHLSQVYDGQIEGIEMEDEFGKIYIHLLPFIKPVHVRHFFKEETILNYTDAMAVVVKNMKINTEERNVLVAHQFVTGASRSDSEEISVGGLDNVEVDIEVNDSLFKDTVSGMEEVKNRISQAIEHTLGIRVFVRMMAPKIGRASCRERV